MSDATMTGRTVSEWIYGHEAQAILGISRPAFRRLLDSGQLTRRRVPSCRPLVLRSEVERLAQRSTQPADPMSLARESIAG